MASVHEWESKEFTRVVRGYSIPEVDEYISELIERYHALEQEKEELESRLQQSAYELDELKTEESDIRASLTTAQKAGYQIITDANTRAAKTLTQTRMDCEKILSDFRRECARERETLAVLKGQVANLKQKLFETYSSHISMIEQITPNVNEELAKITAITDDEYALSLCSEIRGRTEERLAAAEKTGDEELTDADLAQLARVFGATPGETDQITMESAAGDDPEPETEEPQIEAVLTDVPETAESAADAALLAELTSDLVAGAQPAEEPILSELQAEDVSDAADDGEDGGLPEAAMTLQAEEVPTAEQPAAEYVAAEEADVEDARDEEIPAEDEPVIEEGPVPDTVPAEDGNVIEEEIESAVSDPDLPPEEDPFGLLQATEEAVGEIPEEKAPKAGGVFRFAVHPAKPESMPEETAAAIKDEAPPAEEIPAETPETPADPFADELREDNILNTLRLLNEKFKNDGSEEAALALFREPENVEIPSPAPKDKRRDNGDVESFFESLAADTKDEKREEELMKQYRAVYHTEKNEEK